MKDADGAALHPNPSSIPPAHTNSHQVPCSTMAMSLLARPSSTHHTSVPQPSSHHIQPHCLQLPRRGWGQGFRYCTRLPMQEKGPTGKRSPWLQGSSGQLLPGGSCSPAAQHAAHTWPSRKTLGSFSATTLQQHGQGRGEHIPSQSQCAFFSICQCKPALLPLQTPLWAERARGALPDHPRWKEGPEL